MSNPKKFPSLPPDDFDKTTPNMPRSDEPGAVDWEKTNYNAKFAPQPPADDWGKTATNIPRGQNEPDFNKTYLPSQNPKVPDWGVTQDNVRIPHDDFSSKQDDFSRTSYGATSPFIYLPEAERAKYQQIPPTPAEKAQQQNEAQKKGGIPGWFWATAGILTMFFFTIFILGIVWFFFIRETNFEVVITNPPEGRNDVLVNGVRWNVTQGDGTLRIPSLKANEPKRIEIKSTMATCKPLENVTGNPGDIVQKTVECTKTVTPPPPPPPPSDCENFKTGEFEKASKCANEALDKLKEPFSAEDVTKALNMYIINFDVNKFDIKPKDMAFLEKASNYIKKLPPTTLIEIGGHTDSDGTDQKNQVLSENRAKSVRDAFVNKFGVNPNMLTEKGYGESRPRPGNQNRNADEKFQNRRIEYTVLRK